MVYSFERTWTKHLVQAGAAYERRGAQARAADKGRGAQTRGAQKPSAQTIILPTCWERDMAADVGRLGLLIY